MDTPCGDDAKRANCLTTRICYNSSMLDPKFVLENVDLVLRKTRSRGVPVDLSEFIRLSETKREALRRAEDLRARRNKASEDVARLKRAKEDASDIIAEMKGVGDEIKALEDGIKALDEKILLTL
ncbi:MAG: hypothetical protein FJY82_11325, partial [Candidatus Aminicenantes bacterium]|nr:hypothetical protein [Candidatus Aminicenantes bacterium]